MKSAVLHGINEPYIFQEFDKPVPKEHEVLIKVKHAALNHRDVWIQKGQYAGLVFPIICGSDGCGTVEAVDAWSESATEVSAIGLSKLVTGY